MPKRLKNGEQAPSSRFTTPFDGVETLLSPASTIIDDMSDLVKLDQINRPGMLLESEEAARRLGVKVATLYAYVSRGLLNAHPAPRKGRSLFAADEVEALARRGRGGKQVETRVATVTTAITQIRPDGPHFRGVSAVDLARSSTFESTAQRLWDVPTGEWRAQPVALRKHLCDKDALRTVVIELASQQVERGATEPILIAAQLRALITTMSSSVGIRYCQGVRNLSGDGTASIARMLVAQFAPTSCTVREELIHAVEAAMILLADHELTSATLAVRIAASTRSDLHGALLAGLGAMSGPLNGGASRTICELLYRAEQSGPAEAIAELQRTYGVWLGFGHPFYADGDPRAHEILGHVTSCARDGSLELIDAFETIVRAHGNPPPNADFALGALGYAVGMRPDAVESIITIARIAGWGAHYMEELSERPLRYRARAVYAAPDDLAPIHEAQGL